MQHWTTSALLTFLIALPIFANAATATQPFFNHVAINRDHGAVVSLTVKASKAPSLSAYVRAFLQNVRDYKNNQIDANDVGFAFYSQLETGLDPIQQRQVLDEALTTVRQTNFDQLAKDPTFQKSIKQFESKINQSFLEQNVIADLQNPKFFYASEWRKTMLEFAIDAAGTAGGLTPGANLALYIFKLAIDDLITRRAFYQNFTYEYLRNSAPEDLGLSEAEAKLVLSSIYEAKIRWYQFSTSDQAQKNWPEFGELSLAQDVKVCADRVAHNPGKYMNIGSGLDSVFFPAIFAKDSVVINARDARTMNDKSPSLAFDMTQPHRIRNMRRAFEIFLLGVNMAPMPGPISSLVDWYTKAEFVPQIRSEGGLLGIFAQTGDSARADIVLKQSVNPFIVW